MTLSALRAGVRAGQWKAGRSVVEGRSSPRDGRVTNGTVCWKFCLHVIGIRCAVVILHMTAGTGATRQGVVVVHVTLTALQIRVSKRKREANGVVVEIRGLPGAGGVTHLACLRKIQRDVVGIVRLLIVREVAAAAGGGSTFESISRVAGGAVKACMHACQREAGELQVIEANSKPVIETVALLAGGRKTS